MSQEKKPGEQPAEEHASTAPKEGISSDLVLGVGLGILHCVYSNEDEKREDKRWHEQREKDEAEARSDARKAENNYELPDGQPYVPKMPYPVPKDWDWRRVKREEEERRDEEARREDENHREEEASHDDTYSKDAEEESEQKEDEVPEGHKAGMFLAPSGYRLSRRSIDF